MNRKAINKSPRIWLIGSKGMLGSSIATQFVKSGINFYSSSPEEADIRSMESIKKFLGRRRPKWIINCAAYTDVEKAEFDHLKAFEVNAEAVGNLAKIASGRNSNLIHFSTDYVFNGEKRFAYSEEDMTDPISVYGMSKLIGEEKILYQPELKYFIFRISWLYKAGRKCFPETILKLLRNREEIKVVRDQKGSPTYAPALGEKIAGLVKANSKDYGIYNYSDNGETTWYDFACEINKLAVIHGITHNLGTITPVSSSEFPSQVKRPANGLLKKYKVQEVLDFELDEWQDNLIRFFQEIGKNEKK